MATHFSILAGKNSMDRGAWWPTVHGVAKSQTRLSMQAHHTTTGQMIYKFLYLLSNALGTEELMLLNCGVGEDS